MNIQRALLSVYDKTGIVDFARALVDEFGVEILSTGGTAKLLRENDIPVTLVEDITGWGEMLDGRVKTLHPKIHAAILADRDNPAHMQQLADAGIKPIDMVVVNLYPFEKTVANPACKFEDAIEMIDIGGPCLLRAAAKNHKHVYTVIGSRSYRYMLQSFREEGAGSSSCRRWNAAQAYRIMSQYNKHIFTYLISNLRVTDGILGPSGFEVLKKADAAARRNPMLPPNTSIPLSLRYGENPHQVAQHANGTGQLDDLLLANVQPHSPRRDGGLFANEVELSFNNLVDLDSCYLLCKDLVCELTGGQKEGHPLQHICVFVKHTNACGVGLGGEPLSSYERAYLGDPHAAMGGILTCSFPITSEIADQVMSTYDRWGKDAGVGGFFLEVWAAPLFEEDAVRIIRSRKPWGKRVRLLMGDATFSAPVEEHALDFRYVYGGMIAQVRDTIGLNEDQWKVVSKREPTEQEMNDLRLAWLICKHTKSNAISICKDGMLIGNGAGQMSRVMSCRIATWLAQENGHAEKLPGSAAASDAFFPFRDGPDLLAEAGVTAIIQPGGSKRDAETIAACDERGVALIFTGTRHFKH